VAGVSGSTFWSTDTVEVDITKEFRSHAICKYGLRMGLILHSIYPMHRHVPICITLDDASEESRAYAHLSSGIFRPYISGQFLNLT
jgi:hypothetical protein